MVTSKRRKKLPVTFNRVNKRGFRFFFRAAVERKIDVDMADFTLG